MPISLFCRWGRGCVVERDVLVMKFHDVFVLGLVVVGMAAALTIARALNDIVLLRKRLRRSNVLNARNLGHGAYLAGTPPSACMWLRSRFMAWVCN